MTVRWVGHSDVWRPHRNGSAVYAMALVEEAVLETALLPGRHLSRRASIACTSRLALRVALAGTGLNPAWRPLEWQPGVYKAPASCANSGVRFVPTEDVDRLRQHAPELADFGVVEEFVPGGAWELDGFVLDGRLEFFHPLRQTWDEANEHILRYERGEPADGELYRAVDLAVRAVGLDDAPFCAELRDTAAGWKLIEIHARLGEDPGLDAIMWDTSPLERIEQACALGAA
jgi:hypothetical protein